MPRIPSTLTFTTGITPKVDKNFRYERHYPEFFLRFDKYATVREKSSLELTSPYIFANAANTVKDTKKVCTSRGVNEHRLDIMRPKDKTRSYASDGNAELICFPLMMSHRSFAFRDHRAFVSPHRRCSLIDRRFDNLQR
ncbi:hypothetical protein TcasGA2_TC002400 [Tribolium castaneum]|uniref:Uncharacterized protein n=1 Tax=Tribolium castaneum TaxID=7070 RepID=D6WIU7_TRICA|nr:hypothetical protein TcasGA2_TC002400 [Tribolium castaneum]